MNDLPIAVYKQYYKNIEVYGGTYLAPTGPDEPCDIGISNFIISNIYSEIDIDVNPVISREEVSLYIGEYEEYSAKLLIDTRGENCEYNLVWNTFFSRADENYNVFVNATTGEIAMEIKLENSSSFQSYKSQNEKKSRAMSSCWGTNYQIYDGSGEACNFNQEINLVPLISDGLEVCPGDNAGTDAFFADMEKALAAASDLFSPIALENDFSIVTGCTGGSGSNVGVSRGNGGPLNGSDDPTFVLNIDALHLDGTGMTSIDILFHELAHMFSEDSNAIAHSSPIAEAFSDIVAIYLEAQCQGNVHDWVLGDDGGLSIRDAANPGVSCYTDAISMPDLSPHSMGEPFTHLFFLLSEGDINLGIAPLGFDEAFNLLFDGLIGFDAAEDANQFYFELIDLALLSLNTNRCDDRIVNLIKALNAVCIGPGFSPNCYFNINPVSEVCEEDGRFCLNISGPAVESGARFSWIYPPTWTSNITSTLTSQGTVCFDFHNYPYYPQTFEICARTSSGSFVPFEFSKECVDVIIKDCDFDDPACEDVFDLENFNTEVVENRNISTSNYENSHVVKISVYNTLGQVLYSGNQAGFDERLYAGQLLIFQTISQGRILESYKKFILN